MTNIIQSAAAKNAVAAKTPGQTMKDYISRMQGDIAKALPSVLTPERFTRITLSALSTNPKLAECTPKSFLGAMMTAAQLGMEPNTPLGQAYLIPRRNGKTKCMECQFQLGYKGLIDLAYRSGEVSLIAAHTVCANDTFSYEFGLEPKLQHIPAMGARGKPIAFYAMFRTKDGGYGFDVMSEEDVRAHAQKFSEAYKGGTFSPWNTNFEEMAKKTVLKKVLKYAPLKTEFVRGLNQDGSVHETIGTDMTEEADMIFAEGDVADDESSADNEPDVPVTSD